MFLGTPSATRLTQSYIIYRPRPPHILILFRRPRCAEKICALTVQCSTSIILRGDCQWHECRTVTVYWKSYIKYYSTIYYDLYYVHPRVHLFVVIDNILLQKNYFADEFCRIGLIKQYSMILLSSVSTKHNSYYYIDGRKLSNIILSNRWAA